ncbi:MAG: LysM peptidoglycan-binding domain-containing protein [Gammaproteobacteria bacterium]
MQPSRALPSLLPILALALGGCAALPHKSPPPAPRLAALVTPPATSTKSVASASSRAAPTAGTAVAAVSADNLTPIPDLSDTSPEVQWQDLSITPAEAKYDNLWNYLGQHFSLPSSGGDGRVQEKLDWYEAHAGYLQRTANRAKPYLYYVVQQVNARNMPLDIALLPVVESAFDPFGYSVAHAAGLWQFTPGTARLWDLKQNWWYDGRRDIIASTNAALDYLQYLHKQFNDNWLLALAAYNSGSLTVTRAIERNQRRGLPTDFWHLDLPAQTRAYVPWLLAICKLVATPGHDDVDLPPIPNKPYFTAINTDGQIDLATAAKLAGITTQQMDLLNPGFNRWATGPDGPDQLLVPVDKVPQFTTGLAALSPSERVQWAMHRVVAGDTLDAIAEHYHTAVDVLRRVNGVRGNLIRPGQALLIPRGRNALAEPVLVAEARGEPSRARVDSGTTTHRVRRGETLWTIARRYHVSVAQLAGWNGLNPHGLLHIGEKLAIRPHSRIARVTASTDSTDSADEHKLYYTVRSGDSLYSISSRFNVSVTNIASWNNIGPDEFLHPGQRLELYVNASDGAAAGG